MSRKLKVGLLWGMVWALLLVGGVQAQGTPRPTPTNIALSVDDDDEADANLGTIQGVVYQDVNGDGVCVNTGVEGEGPVEGVNVEFVSSDEETVIMLYSGPEGIYGLFAAGHSYWAVTAKPSAEWVVTSDETMYAPIDNDNLVATDVNFCVQKAGTVAAPVFLPASGAAHQSGLDWVALTGLLLLLIGLSMHVYQRRWSAE